MVNEIQLHVVAALLRRGRAVDRYATGVTLLALAFGLAQPWLPTFVPLQCVVVGVAVLLGLWQKYAALRVALDAELFELLAIDTVRRTPLFDQAMADLHLQPATRGGRPWPERGRGALRLLRQQILLAVLQTLVLLAGALTFPWLTFVGHP